GNAVGRPFHDALGTADALAGQGCPVAAALAGHAVAARLPCHNNRYFEVHLTPIQEPGEPVTQVICLAPDVTAELPQQHMLDALHRAGHELAHLSAGQLADLSVEERIELLKQNVRRFTHDLLHYDVIEIRLLDRQSGRLEPLLEEGVTPEAASRVLLARPEG